MKTIAIIYGTRPEAIKIAPLARALAAQPGMNALLVSTGQHAHTVERIERWFGVESHYQLDVLETGQSLNSLLAKVITQTTAFLEEVRPDAVLVQGDTTTVLGAALACFYHDGGKIPVIHLEAGLRSRDRFSPYPEEANRLMVSQISSLLLAPTTHSAQNLFNEGHPPASIAVTGNTVIDALNYTVARSDIDLPSPVAELIERDERFILVTCHRRENWGEPMERVAKALKQLADRYGDLKFLLPLHVNPEVRERFIRHLGAHPQFVLTEALDYPEFAHAMAQAYFIISDSGGVQEEAPSLGKPVLVLRENTERPEAEITGTVSLVGTNVDDIVNASVELLDNRAAYEEMAQRANPFGDGNAAAYCVKRIVALLND